MTFRKIGITLIQTEPPDEFVFKQTNTTTGIEPVAASTFHARRRRMSRPTPMAPSNAEPAQAAAGRGTAVPTGAL